MEGSISRNVNPSTGNITQRKFFTGVEKFTGRDILRAMTDHAELIRKLGGPTAVANFCGVGRNVPGNWAKRGISWQYRNKVAQMATLNGVKLPKHFLEPEGRP